MLLSITRTYRSSFTGLNREVWLLSFVILVNRAGTMVVPFLSMYVTQSLRMSVARAGIAGTLFGVGAVMGTAIAGWLIDKIGFRRVQMLSAFTGGLLFWLLGTVHDFTLFCFITWAVGLVAEAFRPANLAAVAAYATPETLTRSYSLNRLAMNIGWAVGISCAGVLAALNYHLLFWVEGGAFIIVGLLVLFLLPERKVVAAVPEPSTVIGSVIKPASIWRDGYLLRFLGLVAVYLTCFILMFRLVPVFWKENLGIGERTVGLLLGLNGVVIALFEMALVRYWESRRSPLYYVVAGVLSTGIGYLCLSLKVGPPLVLALAAVLFLTLGEMLALPFISSAIMQRADESNRGKYAAAFALAFSVANIVGPAGGALVAATGGYIMLWVALAILCFLCAFGFSRMQEKGA